MPGDLGEQLVPAIADLFELAAVYLYSSQTEVDTEWTKNYVKVKGTFKEMKDLCQVLKKDLRQVDRDLATFDVISPTEMVDLNRLNQSFMYSQLFKEVLLEMEYNDQSKQDFTNFCSTRYSDNRSALNLIAKLKNEYEPRSAISWYTRECFLYSMLNRALRTQDVQVILKMAFFIRDLHQQIQQLHLTQKNPNPMTIYRGQGMTNAEFERIRHSKGGLIFFNNFLSTTFDEPIARMRACSAQDDPQLTGVYFQIDIDPSIRSPPYASLDQVSFMSDDEREILFSMHSVFRITDLEQIDERIWHVKLISTSDDDEQLKEVTDYIRAQTSRGPAWSRLTIILYKMGDLRAADEIDQKMFCALQNEDLTNQAWLQHNIGFLCAQKGDFSTAQLHYGRALALIDPSQMSDHFLLAQSHNHIADAYRCTADYADALSHCQKAIEIQERVPWMHPLYLGYSYCNLALVHQTMGRYSLAHSNFQRALELWQRFLPSNHPQIGSLHLSMGELLHQSTGNTTEALSQIQRAMELTQRVLPPEHFDMASSYNSMGLLQCSLGQYQNALQYQDTALEISERAFPSDHPQLGILHNNIAQIYCSSGDYPAALRHCEAALEIFQNRLLAHHPDLAMAHNTLASVHHSMGENSSALTHCDTAMNTWSRVLPRNQPHLAIAHNNQGVLFEATGDYINALCHSQKAMDICATSLPPDHPHLALMHNTIAIVNRATGNYASAALHFQQAMRVWQKSCPPDHINFGILQNNMGEPDRSVENLQQHSNTIRTRWISFKGPFLPVILILQQYTTMSVYRINR